MRARRLLTGTAPLALFALAACSGKSLSPAVAKNALLPDLDFTAAYNSIVAGNNLAEFGFEPTDEP